MTIIQRGTNVKLFLTGNDGTVTELDGLKSYELERVEEAAAAPAFPSPGGYSGSFEIKLDRKAYDELIAYLACYAPPPLPPVTSRSQALREARRRWRYPPQFPRMSVPKRWANVFIREYTRCREQRLHYLGQRVGMIRKEGAK